MPLELAPLLQTSAPHQLPRPSFWTLNPMGELVGTTQAGGYLATTFDLKCNRPHTRPLNTDLQWNWVSSMEPFGPGAETLPLDYVSNFFF
ncbi:hypothetical protein AVEN_116788-1 [Araneus ventricosus]|uniref:Uncharacterized protein n=1 Tax=Araneus ventricosus TaxID=182803 RepID=A0A4Y2D6J9_ARAVE|nr:hypothetical protein AVEN_116788-1 [Araneus ventricosus]